VVSTAHADIDVLYLVFALSGIAETAADNAALTIAPNVVAVRDLDRANGQITAIQLVADEFAGPRSPEPTAASAPVRQDRSLRRDVLDGVTWVLRNRLFASLAGLSALTSIAYMAPFSVLVLYSSEALGQTAGEYGLLLAVSAVGGLVGSIVAPPVPRAHGYALTIGVSLLLGAASLAGLAATGNPWFAGLLLAMYILHAVVWGICVTSLRQRLVPDHLRWRVNAVTHFTRAVRTHRGSGSGRDARPHQCLAAVRCRSRVVRPRSSLGVVRCSLVGTQRGCPQASLASGAVEPTDRR
jgi:Na+/melibiose symporter-like transporter